MTSLSSIVASALAGAPPAKEEHVKSIVKASRKQWGDRAEVYWNEEGVVVIEKKSGWITEFDAESGQTKHTGFIR